MIVNSEEMKEILEAIVNSKYFEEMRKNRDINIEIDGFGYQLSETDFELETLENFFYEDEKTILSVEPIWRLLKQKIQRDVEEMLKTPETFVGEWTTRLSDLAEDFLDRMKSSLLDLYRKLLDESWKDVKIAEAKKVLPKNQQYVALLDKNRKMTREPIPITRRLEAKISCEIKEEEVKRLYGTVKKRYLYVTSDVPFKVDETCKVRVIELREDEVSAVIIKT